MKKVFVLLLAVVLIFSSGCSRIDNMNLNDIINKSISNKRNLYNEYRTGYKYYLPRGLSIVNQSDYNEKLNTDRYTYYLYVDVVSYYNKTKVDYKKSSDAYISQEIIYYENFGYLEIKTINDKYLVEIMYNYAKIEVIVKKKDINSTVANAMSILSSIKYNKNIIENVMGDNVLQFKETELNIFETKKTDGNYIQYEKMYGQYEEETHDSDLID